MLFLEASLDWCCRLLLVQQRAVDGVAGQIRSRPNNSLWQKQAKEDVETRRDLTGSRRAIHSFSALLILNTSLWIHRKCLSKCTARIEFHITMLKEWNNCTFQSKCLLGEYHLPHFIWSAELFYCTPTDDTPPFFVVWFSANKVAKRLFGANYSQHVLYTPFNELDWRRGRWLCLPSYPRWTVQSPSCHLCHVYQVPLHIQFPARASLEQRQGATEATQQLPQRLRTPARKGLGGGG